MCDEPECSSDIVQEAEPFTLGGTAVVQMQRVWCAAGHTYHRILSVIDEPEETG